MWYHRPGSNFLFFFKLTTHSARPTTIETVCLNSWDSSLEGKHCFQNQDYASYGKMLLVWIIENNKIDAYLRSG